MYHLTKLSIVAFVLSAIGMTLIIIISLNPNFNDCSGIINPELASYYGSFIGGLVGPILSFAGILLIIDTLIQQKKAFNVQQFESKFFELIKFHRDNVAQMELKLPYANDQFVNSYKVFVELKKQFEEILDFVNWFTEDDVVLNEGDKRKQRIQIAYVLFFYGVSSSTQKIMNKMLANYNSDLIKVLFEELRKKKTSYNNEIVYYGGHQSILGHYFRNLFRAIMFVHEYKDLTKKEKYDYVRILRAQLSTYELAILFYNVLSPFGRKWKANNLMREYKLIKNLPPEFIMDINPKDYYPEITYEWEEDNQHE